MPKDHPSRPARAAADPAAAALLDALPQAVVIHRALQPLHANAAAVRLLGFDSLDALLGLGSLEPLLPAESRAALPDAPPEKPATLRLRDAAGRELWAEAAQSEVEWEGAPALVLSLADAGARMRSDHREALLREAIDYLSDSFILYDGDDRVVLSNRSFHELFDYLPPKEDLVGMPMEALVRASLRAGTITDPAYRPAEQQAWIDGFLARRRQQRLHLAEDNWPSGRWDLVKEQRLESGAFVSVRTEITDRKRAEMALKAHELRLESELAARSRQLEAVLANVAQGVVVLDPELRVVLTNPGLHELIGYPPELGRPGTHVSELIRNRLHHELRLPGEPEGEVADVEALVERRLQAYRELTHERYRHPFPNGRHVEIVRQRLPDGMIICTFTDVTEQVKAEAELATQREALYQSEKLSALGMLLAGVAHELNNPLSIVLGQAALLETLATSDSQRDRALRIRTAAERCARIVKTFLAMARDQPASRRAVRLNELVHQSLEFAAYHIRRGGIEVVEELAASLPEVQGDPDQLNQVVVNLLINAAQALEGHEGPRRITLSTAWLRQSGEVELRVADSGPGIPEELRRRVFDPFFTTKPTGAGTGVGLSVCHGMIAAHGGSILAEAAPGGGALFRVRLPAPAEAAAATGAPEQEPAGGGRVLVVDDEPEIGEVIGDFLAGSGLAVETTASGREGLERLLARPYDVVICDLRMPELDGPTLFAEVGRLRPELLSRFVFVTGDLLSESSSAFLEGCGRPYLEKPLLPAQVRRLVAAVAARG